MFLNLLKLHPVRQMHCLCRLQVVSKNICSKAMSESVYIKIPVNEPYLRSISTSSSRKNDVLLEADKDSVKEIYRGTISNYIFKVKAFSLLTSVLGVAAQPIILQKALESESSTALLIGNCVIIGFFTFVTPILLHTVTKKYVLRLEYSPKTDTYTATTYSFFLGNEKENFKVDDVVIPDVPAMLTSFTVKGKSYFIDKDSFHDLNHYKKIMGFDKPLQFTIDKDDSVEK